MFYLFIVLGVSVNPVSQLLRRIHLFQKVTRCSVKHGIVKHGEDIRVCLWYVFSVGDYTEIGYCQRIISRSRHWGMHASDASVGKHWWTACAERSRQQFDTRRRLAQCLLSYLKVFLLTFLYVLIREYSAKTVGQPVNWLMWLMLFGLPSPIP